MRSSDQLHLPASEGVEVEAEAVEATGTLTERILDAIKAHPGLQSRQIADLFPIEDRKTVLTRIGQLVTARRLIKDTQNQRLFAPTQVREVAEVTGVTQGDGVV